MTESASIRAARGSAAVQRLDRTVMVVTGDDAADYLDRTLTNDLVAVAPGEVRRALLLDEDGRTRALLDLIRTDDGYLVAAATDGDTDLAAEWRDNVFIEDVTVEQRDDAVLSVQGPDARDRLTAMGLGVPADADLAPGAVGGVGPTAWRRDRSPAGGYLLIADDPDDILGRLADADVPVLDDAAADALRVQARTPALDRELAGRLPLGMGVDDAIDHDKGCYVGQEVVARVHQRAGGPDRRLVRLDAAGPLAEGAAVLDGDEAVGEVTTAADAPDVGPIALAVLDDDAPRRLRAADGTSIRRVDTAAGLAGDGTAPAEGEVSP